MSDKAASLVPNTSDRSRSADNPAFVDEVVIAVQAGDGGDGSATFRREKYQPKGGPNGGDGGRGGNALVVAQSRLRTLIDLRYHPHWKANHGNNGEAGNRRGADGEGVTIRVPVGTVIHDADSGETLADLTVEGDTCLVARGGRGGRGNARFTSPTHRTPGFAEKGEPGEHRRLRLKLKVLADVGIVGFPNVGKSTLISRISAAKPKIADYPFTTLVPNLGVVRVDSQFSFVVADIPGIIEGAHEGRGLGHQFLRHVERTQVLVHLLDFFPIEGRNPVADFEALNRELQLFGEVLAGKPQIVVANKMDLPEARQVLAEVRPVFDSRQIALLPISAATGEGIPALVQQIVTLLNESDSMRAAPVREPVSTVAPRLPRKPIHIDVSYDYGYVVSGGAVERLVTMTDVGNPEAVMYLQRKLERMGVIRMLRERGIRDGDFVRIGSFVSNFVDEYDQS